MLRGFDEFDCAALSGVIKGFANERDESVSVAVGVSHGDGESVHGDESRGQNCPYRCG